MTALLLDTHTLVWAINEPQRLSDAARAAVADPANDLFVSAASAWELATKHRLGRLPEAEALLQTYETQLARLGARQLAISTADALLAGRLEWVHRDPFDRMLAAQALGGSQTLVTADRAFSGLSALRTLW